MNKQGFRWALTLATVLFAAGLSAQDVKPDEGKLPLDELRTFADVFNQIKQSYVEPVDDKTLLENAIRGMLSGLDPHSTYLDAKSFDELQVNTSGEFGGLGLEVGLEDGFVKVISPLDDTPAQKAGIEAGDLIIKIDGKPVKGMALNEAVDSMRGPRGSVIELTIVREGVHQPFDVKLKRDTIKVLSVKSRSLEPGFGYIRVAQFQANTGPEFRKAVEKLKKENKDLKGLVVDLRNNPGGILQSAVDVADAFIKEGLIVYTEGRLPNSKSQFRATPDDIAEGVPIVVLINGGSASASEIVAGALQDQKRAVIMGTESFGKGSVQTVMPLSDTSAIKLTTARYFTPNGRSIQAHGIAPDVEIERAKFETLPRGDNITEADLEGHLRNGDGGKESNSKARKQEQQDKLISSDNQLYEALTLLKGLNILGVTTLSNGSVAAKATPE
ncbi:MAG TPA: S41 family peptidase [Spongiibacteraceae bacterium]|nr:S41 family peptidase [Spongiibacteraceae bacterium]